MSVSDVSEGTVNILPDFRHRNVALAAIIDERYLAVLCKALDLILVLDECIEQFFRLGCGQTALFTLRDRREGNSFLPSLRIERWCTITFSKRTSESVLVSASATSRHVASNSWRIRVAQYVGVSLRCV